MAEKKDRTPEEIAENELPRAVDWEEISNVPKTLQEIARRILAGWTITDTELVSPPDENGFRIRLKADLTEITFDGGVKIKNTSAPFSGVGGMVITHDTERVFLEVGGSGEGLGGRYVVMSNRDSTVWIALVDTDDGNYYIAMDGLPTSDPGLPGAIYRDGSGNLKISI